MKRVIPAIWFGLMGFFAIVFSAVMIREKRFDPMFVLGPVAMAAFGYLMMTLLVFDLVDEVWDDGDALVIKNKKKEERIPLKDILKVSHSIMTNPPRITLKLRQSCSFGEEITFCPEHSYFRLPLLSSPIASELRERIDEKKRG
jgi:hypothetical protein